MASTFADPCVVPASALPGPAWTLPLPLTLVPTADPGSFVHMPAGRTGLPLPGHPGAFAAVRKHHIHEGVDLYCPAGTPVFAVEAGLVVACMPFTGPRAGLPWWLDTDVVLVAGASGVVAYGELTPVVRVGQLLTPGEMVGRVTPVLRVDKGRPMSMLHLELHVAGSRACPEWIAASGKPPTLRDPTNFLLKAFTALS